MRKRIIGARRKRAKQGAIVWGILALLLMVFMYFRQLPTAIPVNRYDGGQEIEDFIGRIEGYLERDELREIEMRSKR